MQRLLVQRLLALTVLLLLGHSVWVEAAQVEGVRTWAGPDHTRIVFDLSEPVEHRLFTLTDPDRVVVDVKSTDLATSISETTQTEGLLRGIRTGRRAGGGLRVVFDLEGDVRPRSFIVQPNDTYGHRLVVDLEPQSANRSQPVKTLPQDSREFVVAVDAGHGGEDPGAIGVRGTFEKTVVLEVARKLAYLIDREPGMRSVLIRNGDYYIGLRERTLRARAAQADMFLSIHADAFANRNVRGSSVYTLSRSGATSEVARLLAKRENEADRIGGVSLEDKDDVVASVLVDLSRAATIESSTGLAKSLLGRLEGVGQVHRARVERAGFAVLKSLDMPSVLVELAFISNPREERKLRSNDHQWLLAGALRDGVSEYVSDHRPGLQMASARRYVVRSGDTLGEIARRYSVSVSRLRQVNDLSGDTIVAGNRLLIP